jgi:hypothetical protein
MSVERGEEMFEAQEVYDWKKWLLIAGSGILCSFACTSTQNQVASQLSVSVDHPQRFVASEDSIGEKSCQSAKSQAWFNNGKYTVGGATGFEDSNQFPPYSLQNLLIGNKTEHWTSAFVQKKEALPKNRKEFFSLGTMYYFEFEGMNDKYKEAESNWTLLRPMIVGANSKIKIYRIDKDAQALNQECPSVNQGQLVKTIPFFSLRTSGNRTNQMPKSSFKVKLLSSKKWKKLATAQYAQFVKNLTQAPTEINSLAQALQDFLGKRFITDVEIKKLRLASREEFIQAFTQKRGQIPLESRWRAGQLRNGMLWWKGQLEDAVNLVEPEAILAEVTSLSQRIGSGGEQPPSVNRLKQTLETLNAFDRRKDSSSGWMTEVEQRKKTGGSLAEDDLLFGMDSINLKAMWNDPSQMREALAWYMFDRAGVDAPKHTYAKVCFGKTYRGVFSLVEQIDESFIADRRLLAEGQKGNLYKVYMGTEDVGLDVEDLKKALDGVDLRVVPQGDEWKSRVLDSFIDNPGRGHDVLRESPFASMAPFDEWLRYSDYYFKNLGGGTLKVLDKSHPSKQISPYFKAQNIENRTYQLQTDWDEQEAAPEAKPDALPPVARYIDLEKFIMTINAGDFNSAEYFNQVNSVLDVKAFLRWAAVTVLLGGWDNYYHNPQNYYLFNRVPLNIKSQKIPAQFTVLPWDYDQSFSMSFGESATLWWNTDILNWESMRREKRPDRPGMTPGEIKAAKKVVQRPLVTHLLANSRFRAYYLRFIDWMVFNYFHPQNVASLIGEKSKLTSGTIEDWKNQYAKTVPTRQRGHYVRILKEVWDDPSNSQSSFARSLEERLIREISDPEKQPQWFNGISVSSPEKHLEWNDFQLPYDKRASSSVRDSATADGRCDQEAYVNPRSEKDIGQCEEISTPGQKFSYPAAWRGDFEPKYAGIWSLIANSVYQEHMGLPRPRWDIMSRTGRQYRNGLIYDNGYLGRRIVWKELWQEGPEKCNPQYKIFEGIEHHVRERARTVLEQIDRVNQNGSIFKTKANRTALRNFSLEQIKDLPL